MDHTLVRSLEEAAYFSVAKAFVAGANLNFDTEGILGDLQKALNIDDDTSTELVCHADENEEALILKQYDKSIVAAPQAAVPSQPPMRPIQPMVQHPHQPMQPMHQHMQPLHQPMHQPMQNQQPAPVQRLPSVLPSVGYQTEPTYVQPAKKQKKATGERAPASTARGGGGESSRPAPTSRSHKARPPAGARVGQDRPRISKNALRRHNEQGTQADYVQDLNQREREIFTELLQIGVDENSMGLTELHKALLQWYKLDAREAAIEEELFSIGHFS